MVALADLWLPILVSAVFVFIASSLLHMVIPLHKADYKGVPGEDDVMKSMRDAGVKPGSYVIPAAKDMKDMGSPEFIETLAQGPVGFLTVIPNGPMNMGKSLGLWFVYSILIGVLVGYIGSFSLAAGADYMEVFPVTGTVAILGYAMGNIVDSIWKGVCWSITAKFLFDGVVYGLVTAGAFGWLWPGA